MPVVAGLLSDTLGLETAMAIMPAFGLVAIGALLMASSSYAGDIQEARTPPAEEFRNRPPDSIQAALPTDFTIVTGSARKRFAAR